MMFPTAAFAIVLDFAKGNRPWDVEVFESILDLLKWCYRSIAGAPKSVVGDSIGTDDPIEALEMLGQNPSEGVVAFSPALLMFVANYLLGILIEKLKK